MIDWIHHQFDQGTQRAIPAALPLVAPEALVVAGADLARIEAPTLVIWSQEDPFLPPSFGAAYAERLPDARLREVEGAGHFPWLDRPGAGHRGRGLPRCQLTAGGTEVAQ